jgi:DNA-binding NtrC family response regulator
MLANGAQCGLNGRKPRNGLMKKRKSVEQNPARKGAVFVVDDNALLVEFATTALKAAGYSVNCFCDPKAALLAMGHANPKPTVLVTDYDMGGMNGLELIQSSQKLHPALKTILLSGTVDESITLTNPVKVNRFMGKPYNAAQLQGAVARLMRI